MAEGLPVAFGNSTPERHRAAASGHVQLEMVWLGYGPKPGTLPSEEQGSGAHREERLARLCMVAAYAGGASRAESVHSLAPGQQGRYHCSDSGKVAVSGLWELHPREIQSHCQWEYSAGVGMPFCGPKRGALPGKK